MLPCPTPTELTHCDNGDLPEREAAEVLEHVERCEPCPAAIDLLLRGDAALFKPGLPTEQSLDGEQTQSTLSDTCCPLSRGYQMIARCGRRGMGVVYHARHIR